MNIGLKIAIRKAGGMRALARKLGIAYQSIQYWADDDVPAQWLDAIWKATGVPPHELRPDLYRGYTLSKRPKEKELEPA